MQLDTASCRWQGLVNFHQLVINGMRLPANANRRDAGNLVRHHAWGRCLWEVHQLVAGNMQGGPSSSVQPLCRRNQTGHMRAGVTQQLSTASLQAQPDGTHASRGDPAAQYSIMQGKGACEQFIS
jgi:hypothetical protein